MDASASSAPSASSSPRKCDMQRMHEHAPALAQAAGPSGVGAPPPPAPQAYPCWPTAVPSVDLCCRSHDHRWAPSAPHTTWCEAVHWLAYASTRGSVHRQVLGKVEAERTFSSQMPALHTGHVRQLCCTCIQRQMQLQKVPTHMAQTISTSSTGPAELVYGDHSTHLQQ